MNGLGLPTSQPTLAELREQLAMAEACEPIKQELQEAKAAYREALDSSDQDAIAVAKQRKQAAAHHINETRTWLRREARIGRLLAMIPELQTRLAGPILDEHGRDDQQLRAEVEEALAAMKAELPALEAEAAPLRELFGAAGPPIVVEDPDVTAVDMPVVKAEARAMKGGK